MKMFLFCLWLVFVASCASQPAFLGSEEVKALPMPDCKKALDLYIKETSIPFVQTGITANHQAVYFIFASEKEGILVHLVNPGYDWTRDPNFKKAKYKGYCLHDTDGKYFLIYEQRVPSKD